MRQSCGEKAEAVRARRRGVDADDDADAVGGKRWVMMPISERAE